MSPLSLDAVTLGLVLADRIPAADAEVLRVDADDVAGRVTATGPDADAVADRAQAALAAVGYVVTRPATDLPGAILLVTLPTATGSYDPDAQHDRELAMPDFLDLNLDQWEAWLLSDASADVPAELEPHAVAVIEALRDQATEHDARGKYLQAIATMATPTLRYFAAVVGKR